MKKKNKKEDETMESKYWMTLEEVKAIADGKRREAIRFDRNERHKKE